ncbi:DNA-binding response regulator MtrA [subsurface metagenome]
MTSRVLIIEAEPSLSKEIRAALSKASFDVVDVPNFPEALVELAQFKPDLVITDVVLQGGNGMAACYQLHNIFGIPVVLPGLTGCL